MNPEWIGYAAAVFTTTSSMPQLLKVIRSKHTLSISLWMYVFVVCGAILWATYGFLIDSPSIIMCNTISLVMASSILAMKLRHG